MTHFYLTLPSNSSKQYFENNTMTDFTTKLASTIELTNEWEVGLAEIMFPRSWCTIPKDGLYIEVYHTKCSIKSVKGESHDCFVKLYLNGGFYHTMEELVYEINNAAIRAFPVSRELKDGTLSPPVFYHKPTARRIYITLQAGMSIKFPPTLESILGLGPSQNPMYNQTSENLTIRAEMASDLQAGIHALYVYCDLLQYTHVGDIKAPLLRVVNSGGEAGDVVTRYYERPRYIPLQKKNFDSIEIVIRDDLGEKIQFETGKVLLTLHFRRALSRYLL